MRIDISTQHTNLSEAIEETVKEKFSRFANHAEQGGKDTRVHVVLHHDNNVYKVDAKVRGFGKPIFASVESQDMYQAINELSRIIDRQYRKRKTNVLKKVRHAKHKMAGL